uniref:Uncharacterized protein n=1 Tax=Neogobius melanostomus TaxID=47308 RepID=A0A8C6UV80_9GOBI
RAVLHEGPARAQDLTLEPARAVLHEGPARGQDLTPEPARARAVLHEGRHGAGPHA